MAIKRGGAGKDEMSGTGFNRKIQKSRRRLDIDVTEFGIASLADMGRM
jgi:hypothetical protein